MLGALTASNLFPPPHIHLQDVFKGYNPARGRQGKSRFRKKGRSSLVSSKEVLQMSVAVPHLSGANFVEALHLLKPFLTPVLYRGWRTSCRRVGVLRSIEEHGQPELPVAWASRASLGNSCSKTLNFEIRNLIWERDNFTFAAQGLLVSQAVPRPRIQRRVTKASSNQAARRGRLLGPLQGFLVVDLPHKLAAKSQFLVGTRHLTTRSTLMARTLA